MVEAAAKSRVNQSGLFLNAMAAGDDRHWPLGSAAKSTATQLRNELGALLGGPAQVCRSLTRMRSSRRVTLLVRLNHTGLQPPLP